MAIRGDSVRPEPVKGAPETALFRLPLADFTAARNSLAARLKKAGQPAEAERVKAIPKPSVAAWVVNQLSWEHPQSLRELLAAGDRFREAQAKQLAGEAADLRGTLDARRSALNDVSKLAVVTLEASAHAVTPDLLRRVTTTLEALSAYGSQGGPQMGSLTDDLSPPGFETLAALVPRAGGEPHSGPSRLLHFGDSARRKPAAAPGTSPSDEDRARRAVALAAFEKVQQALHEVRARAAEAERELRAAASDAQAAEQAKRDAAAKLEEATAAASAARQRTRSMAAAAEQATQRVEDGERELERARQALDAIPV